MESNCSKRDSAVSSTWRGSHVSRWSHLSLHQTRHVCSNKKHKSPEFVFRGTRRKEAKEAGGAITKYWCFRSSWASPIASLSLVFGRWFGSLDSQDSPQIYANLCKSAPKELNQTTAAVFTCFLVYPCFGFTPASIGVHLHCSNQHLKWRVLNIIKIQPRHISASPVLKAMRKRPSKSARTGAVSCKAASEGPVGVSPGNHQRIHWKKGLHNEKQTNLNCFGLKRNIMTWVIFFEFSHSPFLRPPVLDLSISFSLLLLLFAGLGFHPVWIKFWHFQILETTGMWFQQSSTAVYNFQNTGIVLVFFFSSLPAGFWTPKNHVKAQTSCSVPGDSPPPCSQGPACSPTSWYPTSVDLQNPHTLYRKWPTLYNITKRLETRDAGIRCGAL